MATSEFKICPFCREQIRASAIKCRFCGERIEESAPLSGKEYPTQPVGQADPASDLQSDLSARIEPPKSEELQLPTEEGESPTLDELAPQSRSSKFVAHEKVSPETPDNSLPTTESTSTVGSRRPGMRAAAVLLFINSGLLILEYALTTTQTAEDRQAAPRLGMAIWDIIVGFGLLRGSNGWRQFAVFRAAFGALVFGLGKPLMDQSGTAWELGLFQLIFAGGILALLLGEPPSRKRVRLGIAAAVSAWVGINAVAFGKVIIPEFQAKRAIRKWALPERTFVDEKKSVLISLPEGWVMLPKDNPMLPTANTEMIAVHSESGCFAGLAIESIRTGVQSLDGYLDLVLRARQKIIPNLVDAGRVDANLGKESGRRLLTTWQQEGQKFRGFSTACQDGWNYYLLSGWCIEGAYAKASKQFEALESSFVITKSFSSQIEDAKKNLVAEISYLSPSTIDRLMNEVVKRRLSVDQASRFGFEATNKGMKRLSQQEREEIAQIYAESFKALSPDDLSKWFSYARRAEAGDVFSPAERKEIGRLNNAAFGNLTGTWKVRLQALMGKAMESGFESE